MIKLTKLWNVIFVSKNYAMGTSVMKNTFYLHFHTNRSIKKNFREKKSEQKNTTTTRKKIHNFFYIKSTKENLGWMSLNFGVFFLDINVLKITHL